ncbi:MAG TPA: hypothetical protein DDX89_04570, partial [Candidatus Omnitrophica bacterium]|nr:hypothetical protein [Candidatus Omnitrophota bacterium]
SLVCRVEARLVHPACRRFLTGRLAVLPIGDYLGIDEAHRFRSKALRLWEQLLPSVPRGGWRLTIDRRDLDCAAKARQELAEEFESLLLLGEAIRRQPRGRKAFVIDSARMRYLRSLEGAEAIPFPRIVPALSYLNSLCDMLFLHGLNLARAIRLGLTLIQGIVRQWVMRRPPLQSGASCIYQAMNLNELSLSREDRNAVWIVDGERVKPQDILFVMPDGMEPARRQAFRRSPYQMLSVRGLLSGMPVRLLIRTFAVLMKFLGAYPFRATGSVPKALSASYALSLLTWKPIVDHLKPYSYVVNFGDLGREDPAILYMNAVGVHTAMYCFAANSYLFATQRCGCDFRAVVFSHILVSTVAVWHENFQQFLAAHPQEGTAVRVVGPLMAGDESVLARETGELRQAYGIQARNGAQGLWVITAFDVAAVAKGWLPSNGSTYHLNPYTEEYAAAFLRDMVRLLNERQDLLLVYKPQRDLAKAKFAPSQECAALVQTLREHPRAEVVKDTINPWLPIAVADLSIAMPFTSPALAALHYGRPSIYHDPLNRCQYHRYGSLEGHMMTHGYEALRAKVDELLAGGPARRTGGIRLHPAVRQFVGSDPGTNSTEAFQAMLKTTHTPALVSG